MGRAVVCIVSGDHQVQEILEAPVSDAFAHCEISVVYPRIRRILTERRAVRLSTPRQGQTSKGRHRLDQDVDALEFPGLQPLFELGSEVDVTSGDSLAEVLERFGVFEQNALVYERVKQGDVVISVRCDRDRSSELVREIWRRGGVDAIEGWPSQSWPLRGDLN